MSRVIRISENTFQRLQRVAVPLEDTPASVIERLLDFYDSEGEFMVQRENNVACQSASARIERPPVTNEDNALKMRTPRQRGGIVRIGSKRFNASSVREFYEQTLRFLDSEGLLEKIKAHMPIRTSDKRYLLANNPSHPTGDSFRAPAQYRGYFMESHKNWADGVDHLNKKMLVLVGLSAEYLG